MEPSSLYRRTKKLTTITATTISVIITITVITNPRETHIHQTVVSTTNRVPAEPPHRGTVREAGTGDRGEEMDRGLVVCRVEVGSVGWDGGDGEEEVGVEAAGAEGVVDGETVCDVLRGVDREGLCRAEVERAEEDEDEDANEGGV